MSFSHLNEQTMSHEVIGVTKNMKDDKKETLETIYVFFGTIIAKTIFQGLGIIGNRFPMIRESLGKVYQ